MDSKHKIIAGLVIGALAAVGSVVGVTIPGGGSSDDVDAVITYEVMGGYNVATELPLVVRMARFADCTLIGNCDATELTTLPIGHDTPVKPGDTFWLRIYVHNTASVTVPGVNSHVVWVNSTDGINDTGEVLDAYEGAVPGPVDLGPGAEVERWIHFETPLLPSPGTRNFTILFQHDLENQGGD